MSRFVSLSWLARAQRMLTLRRGLAHQRQIRRRQRPFFVIQITAKAGGLCTSTSFSIQHIIPTYNFNELCIDQKWIVAQRYSFAGFDLKSSLS